jgi:hypothetical protein
VDVLKDGVRVIFGYRRDMRDMTGRSVRGTPGTTDTTDTTGMRDTTDTTGMTGMTDMTCVMVVKNCSHWEKLFYPDFGLDHDEGSVWMGLFGGGGDK